MIRKLTKQEFLQAYPTMQYWEVILPFSGQLGAGGNLPSYLNQSNCDILPNKTGILLQKMVLDELIYSTNLLDDFATLYFFKTPADKEQSRYYRDYTHSNNSDIVDIIYHILK